MENKIIESMKGFGSIAITKPDGTVKSTHEFTNTIGKWVGNTILNRMAGSYDTSPEVYLGSVTVSRIRVTVAPTNTGSTNTPNNVTWTKTDDINNGLTVSLAGGWVGESRSIGIGQHNSQADYNLATGTSYQNAAWSASNGIQYAVQPNPPVGDNPSDGFRLVPTRSNIRINSDGNIPANSVPYYSGEINSLGGTFQVAAGANQYKSDIDAIAIHPTTGSNPIAFPDGSSLDLVQADQAVGTYRANKIVNPDNVTVIDSYYDEHTYAIGDWAGWRWADIPFEQVVFDMWVKIVDPEVATIRSGIDSVLKNYSDLEEYINLVPNIRKQFYWSKRLDQYHNLLAES